jgi:glucose-1-phosphate thymidylyltransferase
VNSYVGPFTAVGDDCEIIDSEVEHSVVLSYSRIIGVARLTDSLIGKNVEVVRTEQRPHAMRLMVGDDCLIELH